ncbi:MAG: hypothetical protein ACR2HD_11020 [Solirubrobacteraceae bacterium]
MGDLLEEAIREHLELKRSRGADPAEVARLEREALGPVQSASAPAPAPVPAAPAAELATEPPYQAEPEPQDLPPVPPPQLPGDAALGDTQAFDPLAEQHAQETDPPGAPPPASAPDAASARPAAASQDWFAEDEPAQPPQPEHDPDLLEKTPEFLEETPEHDRLWFEQKPPRDFNFDK